MIGLIKLWFSFMHQAKVGLALIILLLSLTFIYPQDQLLIVVAQLISLLILLDKRK